jgi:mitofusin
MRRTLLASLDMAAKEAEDEALGITSADVQLVLAIGEEHLPASVKRPRRVFRRT